MSFDADIKRFELKLEGMATGLLPAVAATAHDSIVNGSPLTGAPGQPVDTGNLKASWQLMFPTPEVAEIVTKSVYAVPNETGITDDGRPYLQRSPVGGRHSVALTFAGMTRIVEHETKRLMGEGGNA
jgi:hypothetical protein